MKHISKKRRNEPACLVNHRHQAFATFENYHPREPLKQVLLKEQGYICCYCMSRIYLESMEIEHVKPRCFDSLQLEYTNLLASCPGNRGKPSHLQHCNARKGENQLWINPTDPNRNCESYLRYHSSGIIDSDHPKVRHDLNENLNLNVETLKNNRKIVLFTVIAELNKRWRNRTWSAHELQAMLKQWESRDKQGFFRPFCQCVIGYLKYRIKL